MIRTGGKENKRIGPFMKQQATIKPNRLKAELRTKPLRVGMISLGCAKNLVDAEIMLGSLLKEGIEITNGAAQADVVIVNTCSFIDAAQEESVDTILESAELREAGDRGQGLIVSGCLPQRFREELPKLLPEVDAFMGIDQVADAPRIVREALEKRREKLQHPISNIQRSPRRQAPKSTKRGDKIVNRLAELDAASPEPHVEEPPQSPLVEVNLRPNYIPD